MSRKKKKPERIIVKSFEDDIWPNYGEYGDVHELHIGNDLFTLDITEMWSGCHSNVEFTVKGKPADPDDFGELAETEPQNAPRWGCGNMFFTVWEESPEILEKYGITVEEYDEIGFWLQRCLTVGCCDQCA